MIFSKKPVLYVCFSLDVEEEGLFSGRYQSRRPSVDNVALLPELAPVSKEMGLPLTLFCSHAVFANARACEFLNKMKDECGAEIGAHLHHWSTPPYDAHDEGGGSPRKTHALPAELLAARLESLLEAGRNVQDKPITSFRMGRWDLKAALLPLLASAGIKVDSSICPLRAFKNGPDHFLAPADPYWIKLDDGNKILEAPITQISLIPALAPLWYRGACGRNALDLFHFFGAASANPMWHNSWAMRLAAWLHSRRGGKFLNFFLHSSELMPGGCPRVTDEKAAAALRLKILSFCRWLNDYFYVKGATVSELAGIVADDNYAPAARPGDWFYTPRA